MIGSASEATKARRSERELAKYMKKSPSDKSKKKQEAEDEDDDDGRYLYGAKKVEIKAERINASSIL